MSNDDSNGVLDTEYYLLAGDHLGRVKYNHDTDEHVDGEVLDESGEWHDCLALDIVHDGDEITRAQAAEVALELGGSLDD